MGTLTRSLRQAARRVLDELGPLLEDPDAPTPFAPRTATAPAPAKTYPRVDPPAAHDPWHPGSRSHRTPTFDDLSEQPDEALLPPLDRPGLDEAALSPVQREWRRDGVVVLKNLIPGELIDAYLRVREQHSDVGGWLCPVPYMHLKEIRDLCLFKPLSDTLGGLFGDRMGLHLNLTGWRSTGLNWHQDTCFNPDFLNSWHCAVWIALDEIHPDSGPFEYVPGSHRWAVTRQRRIHAYLQPDEAARPDWQKTAERFMAPAFEREIQRSGAPVKQFLARRGDVLVWHPALVHRGATPKDPTLLRKAIISHFSAVSRRVDMPHVTTTEDGAPYFALHGFPLDAGATEQA